MTTFYGGEAAFPRDYSNATSLTLPTNASGVVETSQPSLFQSFRTRNTVGFLCARAPVRTLRKPDLDRSISFDVTFEMDRVFTPVLELVTEIILGMRKDQVPKPSSWTKLYEAVSVFIANLLRAYGVGKDCFLAVSKRRGDYVIGRYHHRVSLYTLTRVQGFFLEKGWIEVHRGYLDRSTGCGCMTRLKITQNFLSWLNDGGYFRGSMDLHPSHQSLSSLLITGTKPHSLVTTSQGSEVIILRDQQKTDIDYLDDETTITMRKKLRALNAFQNTSRIDVLVPDHEFDRLMEREDADAISKGWGSDQKSRCLDLTKRTLRRIFNASFNRGGRFYGAWYQEVPSSKRKFITINEQPTVELDYEALHPTMLYTSIGYPLNVDPYAIPGTEKKDRKLIKVTLLKMINAKEVQRIERPFRKVVIRDWLGRPLKKKRRVPLPLPAGMTWQEVQDAIERHNEPIRRFFRSGEGVRGQRIDSDIAETVMLRMMEQGILVLPIHDSFIVDYRYADLLRAEMLRAFRERVGAEISISAKPSLIDEVRSLSEEAVNALIADRAASPGYEGYRARSDAMRPHEPLA